MAYEEYSGLKYDSRLKSGVEVLRVQGGRETNPLLMSEIGNQDFKKAVELSLASEGLLSEDGRYKLKVNVSDIEQPLFGLDFTVTTHVNYTLIDSGTNKIVLDEVVVSPYTATIGDAFVAIKRLRLANEGSGKKNIEHFLKRLASLNIDSADISLGY